MMIQFTTGQGRSIHAFEDRDTPAEARRRLLENDDRCRDLESVVPRLPAEPQPSSIVRYSETADSPPSSTSQAVA